MKINIIYIVVILLFGCSNKQTKPPERTDNVPLKAVWHGGADGGAWFVVESTTTENHFYLEVYNDYKGSVWAKGEFILNPECSVDKVFSVEDIRKSIDGWAGETAILSILGENERYCSLIPLKNE